MTAPTIVAAVRQAIIATGVVNARVWLRYAPENATLPYVTIQGDLGTVPSLSGDAATMVYDRQLSVDIWQSLANDSSSVIRIIRNALDGLDVPLTEGKMWGLGVESGNDIPEPFDSHVTHYNLTLRVRHSPAAV